MGSVLYDIRYAIRVLFRNPGFFAVAILSLALGIGANTAVFSLVDTLLFRPTGARDDQQVVQISARTAARRGGVDFSYPDYVDLKRQNRVFSGVFLVRRHGFMVAENGRTAVTFGETVSPDYFDVMGVQPALGRPFLASEDSAGSPEVVVISHGYWQRHFGGDRGILGKTMTINFRPATIVGIAPRNFQGVAVIGSEIWVAAKNNGARQERYFEMAGRLRPGVSINQAQAEMDGLVKALGEAYPDKGKIVGATIYQEGGTLKKRIIGSIPLVLVGFVLLIACATVENLLLARAEARRREVAMRQALGASRGRLVRQLLTEGVVLSLLGGGLGLLLASWLIRFLPHLLPSLGFQLPYEFRVDLRVLAYAVCASVLTALVFGLGPALQSSRAGLLPALQGLEGKALLGFRGLSGRKLLVSGQVAVSLVLMISSGLLTRSLYNLNRVDIGFEKKPMLLMMVVNPGRSPAQARAFQQELEARVKAVPGVRAVSSTSRVPLSTSGGGMTQNVSVEGSAATPGNATMAVRYNVVGTDYFAVMGTRLLRGRYFTEADDERTPKVALINETFARRFWPNQDPVGKHFRASGRDTADWEVAGVSQDGKYNKIDEPPQPFVYFPLAQMFRSELTLIVETAVDPASISGTVMREVRAMNPAVTLDAMTLTEHLRAAMWEQDAVAKLIAGFGGIALFLTCIGLYGVVGYTVSRRTREIGVRMALGASRRTVLAQVLKQGLVLALGGSLAGLVLAFVLVRFLSSFLFGVSPFDPLVFALTTLLLIAVTLLATFVPARRAMSVNPVIALRHE